MRVPWIKYNPDDSDILKDYSEINDPEILIKKLADECKHIANNWKIVKHKKDEAMEIEINKYTNRLKELYEQDKNYFQKWLS